MTSPLAVLSEAAYAYEQMEKLNQLKLASSPVASIPNSYGLGGYPPYGTGAGVPMLLVVPSLYGLNSSNAALLQAGALNPTFYPPPGLTGSSPPHPTQYGAPQPPTNLVLNASLSTGNRSLGSEESDLPPWHVSPSHVSPTHVQSPNSPKQAPVKTSTIVRNPTHSVGGHPIAHSVGVDTQKVVMRQKKARNQIDNHFRRSLGSNYETPVLKKRPATIAYSEVDDHFERVFGAEEWKKLQAKRKKLNRHSVI